MDLKYLFTNFSGRIGRQQYWKAVVIVAVAWIAIRWGANMLVVRSTPGAASVLIIGMSLIGFLLFVAIVPVLVKRLHDRNKSGHYVWPFLAAIIASHLMNLLVPWSDESWPVLLSDLIFLVIWLWYFVELGFFYGTAGPNSYGPDPVDTDPIAAMSAND